MTDTPDWTKWHVGQKVVCVDDSHWRPLLGETGPVAGVIYTVRDVGMFRFRAGVDLGIRLVEIVNVPLPYYGGPPEETGFNVRRFRPLVTKSDPIEIFRAMTRNTPEQNATRILELEKIKEPAHA